MNTIRLNTIGTPFPKAEGGGGDTPSGGSTWRYFDISKLDNSMKPNTVPFIVKDAQENYIRIVPPLTIYDWTTVTAFGVDDGPKLYVQGRGFYSWSEMLADEGLTPEVMAQVGIVEITEEEFYNTTA